MLDGVAGDERLAIEFFGVGETAGAAGRDCRFGEKGGSGVTIGQDRGRQNIDIDRRFDVGFGAKASASVAKDDAEADDGGGSQCFCFNAESERCGGFWRYSDGVFVGVADGDVFGVFDRDEIDRNCPREGISNVGAECCAGAEDEGIVAEFWFKCDASPPKCAP